MRITDYSNGFRIFLIICVQIMLDYGLLAQLSKNAQTKLDHVYVSSCFRIFFKWTIFTKMNSVGKKQHLDNIGCGLSAILQKYVAYSEYIPCHSNPISFHKISYSIFFMHSIAWIDSFSIEKSRIPKFWTNSRKCVMWNIS